MINKIRSINFEENTSFFIDVLKADQPLNLYKQEQVVKDEEYEDYKDYEDMRNEEYDDASDWYEYDGVVEFIHQSFDPVIYNRYLFKQNYLNNSFREICINYITYPFEKYFSDFVNKIFKTDKVFKEIFSDRNRFIKPKKFDELVAYKCGLIPLYYRFGDDKESDKKVCLLMSGNINCDRVLARKLDAYRALTEGKLDENSRFFRDMELTEYVLGTKLLEEVINSLG